MIHCKRFALFSAPRHDEGGGWYDFVGMFDTVEDAQAAFPTETHRQMHFDAHVADLLLGKVVAQSERAGPWEPVA